MKKITIDDVRRYENRMVEVKRNGFKAYDFKSLGRELQSEFPYLTIQEVVSILNGDSDKILKLL